MNSRMLVVLKTLFRFVWCNKFVYFYISLVDRFSMNILLCKNLQPRQYYLGKRIHWKKRKNHPTQLFERRDSRCFFFLFRSSLFVFNQFLWNQFLIENVTFLSKPNKNNVLKTFKTVSNDHQCFSPELKILNKSKLTINYNQLTL